MKAKEGPHHTVITSDQPVNVVVGDQADGRWFRLFHAVIESGIWAKLSLPASKVYVTLAKYANNQWLAWPSVQKICRLAGLKERSIYRAIDELEGARLLNRRDGGGGRKSTTYQLLQPPLSEQTPLSSQTGVGCPARQGSPVPPDTQLRLIEQDLSNSSSSERTAEKAPDHATPAADKALLKKALATVGIGEPMLGQLVAKLPAEAADIVPDLTAQAKQRAKRNWRGLLVRLLESDGVALLGQAKAVREKQLRQRQRIDEAREHGEAKTADELADLRARRG